MFHASFIINRGHSKIIYIYNHRRNHYHPVKELGCIGITKSQANLVILSNKMEAYLPMVAMGFQKIESECSNMAIHGVKMKGDGV